MTPALRVGNPRHPRRHRRRPRQPRHRRPRGDRRAGDRPGFPLGHLRHPHPAAHALPLRGRARHGRQVHPGGRLLRRPPRDRIAALRERFRGRIRVRWGVELEWLGTGLGLEWSRAKLFQAHGADFVIGSVHFSPEGIPYDGSPEDTARLIALRGGVEPFWAGYFDEVAGMVDAAWRMISVVGHLDLPRLFAPAPRCLADLDRADDAVARRLFTVLGMVAERGLALDLNLAGVAPGRRRVPRSRDPAPRPAAGHPDRHRLRHAPPRGAGQRTTRRACVSPRRPATATTSRSPGASPRSGRSRPAGERDGDGLPHAEPRHRHAQQPAAPRAGERGAAPLLRRRLHGAVRGLPRGVVPRRPARGARVEGRTLGDGLRQVARGARRGRSSACSLTTPTPRERWRSS